MTGIWLLDALRLGLCVLVFCVPASVGVLLIRLAWSGEARVERHEPFRRG